MSRRKLTRVQRRVLRQFEAGTFDLGAPYSRYKIARRLQRRGYIADGLILIRCFLTAKGRAALYA